MNSASTDAGCKHLLVVDDEDHIREVVQACLESLVGWQISLAASGEEALQKAIAEHPDAIVLDVLMPEMDGVRLLQRLRANPATLKIPVVLLTVRAEFTDPRLLVSLGVAGAIAKPFDPTQLPFQVAQALGWSDFGSYGTTPSPADS